MMHGYNANNIKYEHRIILIHLIIFSTPVQGSPPQHHLLEDGRQFAPGFINAGMNILMNSNIYFIIGDGRIIASKSYCGRELRGRKELPSSTLRQ